MSDTWPIKPCDGCGGPKPSGRGRKTCDQCLTDRVNVLAESLARRHAYDRWRHMIERCTDPTCPSYENYGGRGISVCDRWLASFDDWYADVGDPPAPGLTLDRVDNDGPYHLGNIRWATRHEQNLNKRKRPRFVAPTCVRNHPWNDENTYISPQGQRFCRACHRVSKSASRRRAA